METSDDDFVPKRERARSRVKNSKKIKKTAGVNDDDNADVAALLNESELEYVEPLRVASRYFFLECILMKALTCTDTAKVPLNTPKCTEIPQEMCVNVKI